MTGGMGVPRDEEGDESGNAEDELAEIKKQLADLQSKLNKL